MLLLESKKLASATKPRTSLYVCQSPACRRQVRLSSEAISEGATNPRCACGSEMKKRYSSPQLVTLTKAEGLRRMATSSKSNSI
jgi:hypothetical protein